jgi:hypothetical protein
MDTFEGTTDNSKNGLIKGTVLKLQEITQRKKWILKDRYSIDRPYPTKG